MFTSDLKPTSSFKRQKLLCDCLYDENSEDNHENDPNEDDYEQLDYEGGCFLSIKLLLSSPIKSKVA